MATQTNTPKLWQSHLPTEGRAQNKYSRGHVLVIAGGETPTPMAGASKLTAMAARRMGAGLVTVMGAEEHRGFFLDGSPGVLFEPSKTGPKSGPKSGQEDLSAFCQLRKVTSLVVGQGLGKNDPSLGAQSRQIVLAALACGLPTVIDADGLTAFAQKPSDLITPLHDKCVLTPHEAEFLTFFNTITDHGKLAATQLAAHKTGAIVVQKGPETIIASGIEAVRNDASAPLLATAGSGDVLAGVISSLLGKRMPPLYAACAGVWAHSQAGQKAGFGLIAEDLPLLCAQTIAPYITINTKA